MKEKFQQFMYGRYGTDSLNRALLIGAVILIVINLFVNNSIIFGLEWAFLILVCFRSFSRNTAKRTEENEAYERVFGRFKGRFANAGNRAKQMKTHKFYKCPHCSQQLRVPRGSGRISITCPKCHNAFIKKT